MKQLTTTLNGHTILLVEVPENATNFDCFAGKNYGLLSWTIPNWRDNIRIPSGNWKLLGLCSEITEEVAAGLVEHHIVVTALVDQKGNRVLGVLYRNYISRSDKKTAAVESLQSFVKSHHFNPETTVILIKE